MKKNNYSSFFNSIRKWHKNPKRPKLKFSKKVKWGKPMTWYNEKENKFNIKGR